jgi:hypothetical protein
MQTGMAMARKNGNLRIELLLLIVINRISRQFTAGL